MTMKNSKYDDIETAFYAEVKDYIYSRRLLPFNALDVDLPADTMVALKTISGHPSWFASKDDSNDYHVYFAFLEAYHAICDYVKNDRQDSKKLEKALKSWYAVIKQKQNILSLLQGFVKKR